VLRRHRAAQNEQRLQLGASWKDWGLVFPSGFGKPVGDDMVRKVFARICAAADVPVIRIHDLRHTCATLLLAAGVDVKTVAERLGHANPNITLKTYAHVLPAMRQRAAAVLGGLLGGSKVAVEEASGAETSLVYKL
jgi:integrase